MHMCFHVNSFVITSTVTRSCLQLTVAVSKDVEPFKIPKTSEFEEAK
jgi:hypothetical protein